MVNLVYGALLLHSAGKPITEENVKKVVEAAGEKVGDAQIKVLVAALEGVNIEEAISKAAIAPVAAPVEKKEEKKEEEKEEDREKKATEAAAGLGALFG